jgi:hypothetical protein
MNATSMFDRRYYNMYNLFLKYTDDVSEEHESYGLVSWETVSPCTAVSHSSYLYHFKADDINTARLKR